MSGTIWIVITIMLVVGGYQKARQHEREHGYIPWGLPAWAWSLLWGLGLIIGAILWVIATRVGKPPVRQLVPQDPSVGVLAPSGHTAVGYASAGSHAAGKVDGTTAGQVVGMPAAVTGESVPGAPAGWYPDPAGAGQRYWTGHEWTEHTAP